MSQKNQNPYSHLTAKERNRPSFPTREIYKQGLIRGRVLDFGCGYGSDVIFLKAKAFDVQGYDPAYAPEYPTGKFDTILCNYVLNVLLPEEQAEVLMQISELLKPDGHACFSVRRDLRYEGFRTHRKYQKKTYQCNVKLPWKSVFLNDFCEIYEYQPYPVASQTNSETDCPFCRLDKNQRLITESATAFAIFDKYPVSPGHSLIIPKRHIGNYFELTAKEQTALWIIVNRVKKMIQEEFDVHDFNIGINIGAMAGQTVNHVHIHLIPRYEGDVEDPTGGVRFVIPGKANYRKRGWEED